MKEQITIKDLIEGDIGFFQGKEVDLFPITEKIHSDLYDCFIYKQSFITDSGSTCKLFFHCEDKISILKRA